MILAGLFAECFWGGFAGSPDEPASRLGGAVGRSLHPGYRVECETSGVRMDLKGPP